CPDLCVELIDFGGPSMVRAGANNPPSVAVVVDAGGYDDVLAAVRAGGFTLAQRTALAAKAFQHTAGYDVAVASWLTGVLAPSVADQPPSTPYPAWIGGSWERAAVLRYGENPHQSAALYTSNDGSPGLAQAQQLHGKEMSYNNYTDADAAWRAAYDHEAPAVAIIKHANPCGIAIGADIAEAHRKAHACDPVSAFGGVIAANREVTVEMAEQVADIFTEVIVAPSYADGAVEVLQRKKNVRILIAEPPQRAGVELRPISGGALLQQRDILDAEGDDPANWTLVAGTAADEQTLADLAFAWRACRAVKSNAILLASDGASVGVGMGQVNRVDAVQLAVRRAGDRAKGSVAASDAFFPFPDGPQQLIQAGVRAIVQPGGSVRDQETIDLAREAGVTLYLTGSRHFAH
uniref:bifunctional phosphoribosylaminoimidazolecarboxamide formyltransferase/IMP cyclohydrolase n=1 Tax=Nocardia farcinica TaxID=37329 RepID=UPI002454EDE4